MTFFDADSGRQFDFIWDFSVYHSRWKELTSEDFKTPTSPERARIHALASPCPPCPHHRPRRLTYRLITLA